MEDLITTHRKSTLKTMQYLIKDGRTFEDYLNRIYRENSNRSDFTMLARNEQEIDYDLIVNKVNHKNTVVT